jgi:ribosomal-protein-alanine N-acetyltransferase
LKVLGTLVIRDLEGRDLERVRELLSGAREARAWAVDDLLAPQRDFQVRVAEQEGAVCGVVIFRVAADEAEILNIVVQGARRRLGIGSRLMNDVLEACRIAGAQKIYLEVRDSNSVAREFYSRLGFREAGRRRNYYPMPPEDALVLVRTM